MSPRFSRKVWFSPGVSMQDLVRGGNFHNLDGQHLTLTFHDAPAKRQSIPASLAILRARLTSDALYGSEASAGPA